MSQDRRPPSPPDALVATETPVEATFIPQRYEPNYPYPLLVMLHGRGGDEQQLVKLLPTVSWRNYVGLGLRGSEPVQKRGRQVGFDWGQAFHHPRKLASGVSAPQPSPSEVVDRVLRDGVADAVDRLEDHVFQTVRRTRRALHIHSERIFLVGCGEGAAVAFRLGLTYPERFAGVVALNGWMPQGFRCLGRMRACRDLRVLVVHGLWNARAPIDGARAEVSLLRAAGLQVAFQSYPTAHRLTGPMLADVDTWLINQCNDLAS
jgi:phospholipase/carboxylesterase